MKSYRVVVEFTVLVPNVVSGDYLYDEAERIVARIEPDPASGDWTYQQTFVVEVLP